MYGWRHAVIIALISRLATFALQTLPSRAPTSPRLPRSLARMDPLSSQYLIRSHTLARSKRHCVFTVVIVKVGIEITGTVDVCVCVWYRPTVIIICHTVPTYMATMMILAQQLDMTRGDYGSHSVYCYAYRLYRRIVFLRTAWRPYLLANSFDFADLFADLKPLQSEFKTWSSESSFNFLSDLAQKFCEGGTIASCFIYFARSTRNRFHRENALLKYAFDIPQS